MLFGVSVSCRILYFIVSYLYVSIISVGEERANLSAVVYLWFLFGEVSPSSWCLGWVALFYCGTPWAYHIIILKLKLGFMNAFLAALCEFLLMHMYFVI